MREVVITGIGLVSPIGFEKEEFFSALCEGRSGVRVLEELESTPLASRIGARVGDFQAKKHVKPRKNIKVMSRDIQMGFVAADKAWIDAEVVDGVVDPERLGVIFGALADGGGRHPGDLLDFFRCVFRDCFGKFIKTNGPLFNKFFVI